MKPIKNLPYSILLIISILLMNEAKPQGYSKTDSLESLLQYQMDDTARINLLNNLSFDYLFIDVSKSLDYVNTALKLAQEISYTKGTAVSYRYFGLINNTMGNYNEALEFYQKAMDNFHEISEQKSIVLCNADLATTYYYLSDYLKCVELGNLALVNADTTSSRTTAYIYKLLGVTYSKLGDFSKALEYNFSALDINKTIGESNQIADCYNNIAVLHKQINELDNAISYCNKAIVIFEKENNNKGLATVYNNIGNVYLAKQEFEKAIEYFNFALQLFEKLHYLHGKSVALVNIGEAHFMMKDYDAAKYYYEESLNISKEIGDMEGVSILYNNLAQMYEELLNFKLAKHYAKQSVEISTEVGNLVQQSVSFKILFNIFEKESNYKEAFRFLNLYTETSDSIYGIEKIKEFKIISNRQELNLRDKEIELVKKENENFLQKNRIQELQLARNKIFIASLVSVIVLIMLLVGFNIHYRRVRFKKNQEITLIKNKLEKEKLLTVELERKKLENELLFRKQELLKLATFIIEKNNLIKEILVKIKDMQANNHTTPMNALRQLIKFINLTKSRNEYYYQIEEFHKDFYYSLYEKYPDLKKNEKLLAVLLRMELNTKEISKIMNISEKSVEMNRYRLRKKIKIDTNTDLVDFFKNL